MAVAARVKNMKLRFFLTDGSHFDRTVDRRWCGTGAEAIMQLTGAVRAHLVIGPHVDEKPSFEVRKLSRP